MSFWPTGHPVYLKNGEKSVSSKMANLEKKIVKPSNVRKQCFFDFSYLSGLKKWEIPQKS